MERPQFSAPVLPSMESPSSTSSSKCGTNYHIPFEIRAPFKSTDKYSTTLPIAWSETSIGSVNISDSLPVALKGSFHVALKAAIEGAREILGKFDDEGYIDTANRTKINQMLARSEEYIQRAKEIREWWDEQYRPDPDAPIYGWPLSEDNVDGCQGFAPSKGGAYVSLPGQGMTNIEFTCPTPEDAEKHDADRESYRGFLYAALVTARCAQEAAAAVGTFNRNKEYAEQLSGGMVLAQGAGGGSSPGKTLATGNPPKSRPEDPSEDGEPEVEVTPESKPKKKKDNTLLMVGAAGLGFLLLKGRR